MLGVGQILNFVNCSFRSEPIRDQLSFALKLLGERPEFFMRIRILPYVTFDKDFRYSLAD
jgi:hypothetical protein